MLKKKIAIAVVVAGGLMAATVPAHARGSVSFSIGVGAPLDYGYVPPPSYYSAPVVAAPVYYDPPAYYGPPPVVYAPPPRYYGPRYYGPRYYGPPAYAPVPGYYRHGYGRWHEHDGRDRDRDGRWGR